MPKITINDLTIEMPEGAPLLEAARLAGVFAETPCGGKGTCKKCLCDVNGEEVLLCQTQIHGAMTVTLPKSPEGAGQFDGNADVKPYLPSQIDPFVKKTKIIVAPPAALDGLSDADRLYRAFPTALPLSVLRTLPEKLRENNGHLSLLHTPEKIISIENEFLHYYGAAIDIGTTTIALWMVDLTNGEIVFSRTAYNGQIDCGLDVISRIHYAQKYLPELTRRVLETINGLLTDNISVFSLTGNTTMIHLLLGIVPEYIRLSPYTPAVMNTPVYSAGQIGLKGFPEAPVLIAPAVGSYVGGDITAGALCTSLADNSDETVLFIDIGTNGELLLGNQEFLFGCACSAGPAFEGGGLRHGMRASAGAIEKVSIDETGKATVTTIGNAPAIGICGSGVISLVAELFRAGLIDMAGKFMDNAYVKRAGRSAEYQVTKNIVLTEADIDNFIRAKAAIFSACQTLMESVGLTFDDIDRFYVAGGFGRFLNLEDARTIGLLPNLPEEKFVFLGNSSLIGAYLSLISEERRAKVQELASRLTYVDLSGEAGYMEQYMAALFLPHTDRELFG